MKIAIDARLYGPDGTGIGRYLENFLRELEQIDSVNEYIVLLRKNNYHLFNPKAQNFKKILTNANSYTVKEQVLVPAVLAKEKPDLVHFPHLNVPLLWSGNFVMTLHDLTMDDYASSASTLKPLPIFFLKKEAYKVVLNQAVKRALKIFVPSKFVKGRVRKQFEIEERKLQVTPEAVDEVFIKEGKKKISEGKKKKILSNFGIKDPYFLYVGRFFPHKNLDTLLQAFKTVNDKETRLVLVGKRDRYQEKLMEKAKKLGIEERVIFTGYVSNEDLTVLYQNSLAFVFPSLSEGFGLPGLEAMACGCPVVAAKSSSLPEVYGKAALYFRAKSSKDLAKKLEEVRKNEIREELINQGFEQIKGYSWRALAETTLKMYNQFSTKRKRASTHRLGRILFFIPILALVFSGAYFLFKNITHDPHTTVVASGIESTFAVFGDSGVGFLEQKMIGNLMEKKSPEFLLHTGDVAYMNGTYEQIQEKVLDVYQSLFQKAEFYPSLGNHDAETDAGTPLANTFTEGKKYYSFSKGSVLYVALDSTYSLDDPDGAMLTWFDQLLEQEKGKFAWTVVYFHHPPFTTGIIHGGDQRVTEKIVPLIDKHKVDVVFNGHEHNYQRTCLIRNFTCQTEGTLYVITGGGGAPLHPVIYSDWFTVARETTYHFLLVDVNKCIFDIRAIDIEDKVFDEITLKKC